MRTYLQVLSCVDVFLGWVWGFWMWSFLPTSRELPLWPCYLGISVQSMAGHLPFLSHRCLVSASTSGHLCISALASLRHSTGSHRFSTCSPAPTCRFSTQRSVFHYSFSYHLSLLFSPWVCLSCCSFETWLPSLCGLHGSGTQYTGQAVLKLASASQLPGSPM